MSVGTDAMLLPWDHLQVFAFPPFAMIHQIILKLRQCHNIDMILIAPFWPEKPWFSDLLDCLVEIPLMLPEDRSSQIASFLSLPSEPPRASASCVVFIKAISNTDRKAEIITSHI